MPSLNHQDILSGIPYLFGRLVGQRRYLCWRKRYRSGNYIPEHHLVSKGEDFEGFQEGGFWRRWDQIIWFMKNHQGRIQQLNYGPAAIVEASPDSATTVVTRLFWKFYRFFSEIFYHQRKALWYFFESPYVQNQGFWFFFDKTCLGRSRNIVYYQSCDLIKDLISI